MSSFTLPSGKVIETQEPTFAQEVHAISVGLKDAEAFTIAKILAVVKGMTQDEYEKLDRPDGRALLKEADRIFQGRPEKEEVPLSNGSPLSSMASSLER